MLTHKTNIDSGNNLNHIRIAALLPCPLINFPSLRNKKYINFAFDHKLMHSQNTNRIKLVGQLVSAYRSYFQLQIRPPSTSHTTHPFRQLTPPKPTDIGNPCTFLFREKKPTLYRTQRAPFNDICLVYSSSRSTSERQRLPRGGHCGLFRFIGVRRADLFAGLIGRQ